MAITCDCPMSQPGPTLAATCGGGAFMLFMGLLEVFLRSQCDLEDPCGRAQVSISLDYLSSIMRHILRPEQIKYTYPCKGRGALPGSNNKKGDL